MTFYLAYKDMFIRRILTEHVSFYNSYLYNVRKIIARLLSNIRCSLKLANESYTLLKVTSNESINHLIVIIEIRIIGVITKTSPLSSVKHRALVIYLQVFIFKDDEVFSED